MIKPVTFQGCVNFDANLYAVEVRSRFIDQTKANGYYRNYGEDIAASVIAQSIRIGTGAFLVQGRMVEITAADGRIGYFQRKTAPRSPAESAFDHTPYTAAFQQTCRLLSGSKGFYIDIHNCHLIINSGNIAYDSICANTKPVRTTVLSTAFSYYRATSRQTATAAGYYIL